MRHSQRRFWVDRSVERFGEVILGGSPLRILRFTATGTALLDRLWRARAGNTISVPAEAAADPLLSRLLDRLVGSGVLHPRPASRAVAIAAAAGSPADERDNGEEAPVAVTIVTPAYAVYGAERTLPGSLVVDDGSQPPIGTASFRLDTNQGPAAARNAGLDLVSTELVAFVDTDVHVDPDWLNRLAGHFDDPLVALVAPRVRCTEQPNERSSLLARYETSHSPLDLGPEPALIVPGGRVAYVPATAIVCRTEALRHVGGFDESLRFGEDVDLVWRLTAAGFRCRFDPAVIVTHPPRSTWIDWWRQRMNYGTSAAPLAARHGDAVAPARLNRWSLATWVVALGGGASTVAAIAIGVVSAAGLPRQLPSLPPRRALRLGLAGTWRAGDQLATAIRRGWWPILVIAAVASRRARRGLVLSVIAARNPVRLADDVAYSVGVWRGCWQHRSLRAMTPKVT